VDQVADSVPVGGVSNGDSGIEGAETGLGEPAFFLVPYPAKFLYIGQEIHRKDAKGAKLFLVFSFAFFASLRFKNSYLVLACPG